MEPEVPVPDRSRRRWAAGLAVLVVVAALVGIGALAGVGVATRDDRTEAGSDRAGKTDRQAASGTGTEGLAAIGNAAAGNCLTQFAYRTIRVRVEATTDSTERVLAFFPNTPGGVQTIPPGGASTFTLDKGRGHCRFDGPTGELEILAGPVTVSTREGWTNTYAGYTKIDGAINGVTFSLREGQTTTSSRTIEVIRSSDPGTGTAEVVVRVRNRES